MADTTKTVLKPDSPQVLEHGTGTPYVAIFNQMGTAIVDPVTLLPLGVFVTSFEYTYSDDKGHTGKFDIHVNNPAVIDLPELGYKMGIQLQWGYIYPSWKPFCGPIRRVILTDRKVTFGQEGVKATYEFKDAASLSAKESPADYSDLQSGLGVYVLNLLHGWNGGLSVIDYKAEKKVYPTLVQKVRDISTGEMVDGTTIPKSVASGTPVANPNATGRSGTALDKLTPNGVPVYGVEQQPTKEGLGWPEVGVEVLNVDLRETSNYVVSPEAIEDALNPYMREIEQGTVRQMNFYGREAVYTLVNSKNKWNQFGDLCKRMKKGPWFRECRDGKMILHNRPDRPVSKVYTYAGGNGELLEFEVTSKAVRAQVNVTSTSRINPDTKDLELAVEQVNSDPNAGIDPVDKVDGYAGWPSSEHQAAEVRAGRRGYQWGDYALPGIGKPTYDGKNSYTNDLPAPRPRVLLEDMPYNATHNPTIDHIFTSVEAAKKAYQPGGIFGDHLTDAEVQEYMSQLQNRLSKAQIDPTSGTELRNSLMGLQDLGKLRISRKVKVNVPIDFEAVANSGWLTKELIADGLDLSKITRETAAGYEGRHVGGARLSDQDWLRELGVKVTWREPTKEQLGTSLPYQTIQGRTKTGWAVAYAEYETELKVDIDGVRILASDAWMNRGANFINSMANSLYDQLTAQAKIVGDPSVENTMQFQIQNVSDKFSGVWYIKKVTHKIDIHVGYQCDIEFTKRSVSVSTNTVEVKKNHDKLVEAIHKKAQEAVAAGGGVGADVIEAKARQIAEDLRKKTGPGYIGKNSSLILGFDGTEFTGEVTVIKNPVNVSHAPREKVEGRYSFDLAEPEGRQDLEKVKKIVMGNQRNK